MRIGTRKRKQFGYEPDPLVARRLMGTLVDILNKPMIKTYPPDPIRPGLRKEAPRFSAMQEELRKLVALWQDSGPNVEKLFRKFPQLGRWSVKGRMYFRPTATGRAYLDWEPESDITGEDSSKVLAMEYFLELISNPNWEFLGGPCDGCAKYYLKNTKRQKVYCSRKCAKNSTAKAATDIKRKQEEARKISLAKKLIAECSEPSNWKRWVAHKSDLTVWWLTRAVNDGRLRSPGNLKG